MELYFREFGHGEPLVILHGLFGSSDNWATLAKKFGTHYRTITVDLRNHGRSPHDTTMNYEAMVEDLGHLVDDLGLEQINLMGHSMGGKVAMLFADRYPKRVKKLIVIDISPKDYPVHHEPLIMAMKRVPLGQISSRKEAEDMLSQSINEFGILQFLLKNLTREGQAFKWKINLPALHDNLGIISSGLDLDGNYFGPTLFYRGGNSNYVLDEDWDDIKKTFSNASLMTLDGVGHWLHAENPEAFYKEVSDYLAT